MSRVFFLVLEAVHAFGTTTTNVLPVTYNKLPNVPVYREPFIGYGDDATRTSPDALSAFDLQPAAVQQGSSAWPAVAMLGVVGAMLGVAYGRKTTAVADPDLESAIAASHIATLAVGGKTKAVAEADVHDASLISPMFTRRDALLAGAAGMIASVPFAAYAEDESAPASEQPTPAPAAPGKKPGPFDAPPRKGDQSKIGVSPIKVPDVGYGNPGSQIPGAKIYTDYTKASAVVGPNGASGNSSRGFYDGGETKPKSDFTAPGKNKYAP
jgi:hypothetical protein